MPIRADMLYTGAIIDLEDFPGLPEAEKVWTRDWYATVLDVVNLGCNQVRINFVQKFAAYSSIIVGTDYEFRLSSDLPMITTYSAKHKGGYDLEYDVDRAVENAHTDGKLGYPQHRLKGRHNEGLERYAMWEWELMHGYVASERYDKLWGGNEVKKYMGFYGEGED